MAWVAAACRAFAALTRGTVAPDAGNARSVAVVCVDAVDVGRGG